MKRILVITGPTATGKTDLAIEVASEIQGNVISADSRQVYAGMNIGTAKPSFAWRDEVHDALEFDAKGEAGGEPGAPHALEQRHHRVGVQGETGPAHYLFNIRQPNKPLSLSEWQAMAFTVIDQIHKSGMPASSAGKPAVLAGGTMLYIDSIIKNYDLPHVPPNAALRAKLEAKETDQLYAELLQADPAAGAFVQPQNKRRIIRALEVTAATGQPFSTQRRQRPPRYDSMTIGLFDNWEALEIRIAERIATMLKNGLVQETQHLIDQYGQELPLLQTMNYKQAVALIKGELTEDAATSEMLRANIRYARRQMSWWRGRPDIAWYSPTDHATIKKRLLGN